MTPDAQKKLLAALNDGAGLTDEFIYRMDWEDYRSFPGPFPRRSFTVEEAQETTRRPEFVLGEIPDDRELENRLAVCSRSGASPNTRAPSASW
ncbi:MAG TPA: hypothetical protein VGL11_22655 [Candidatus Binatia bacterium]|jgi:hypothetical protein